MLGRVLAIPNEGLALVVGSRDGVKLTDWAI